MAFTAGQLALARALQQPVDPAEPTTNTKVDPLLVTGQGEAIQTIRRADAPTYAPNGGGAIQDRSLVPRSMTLIGARTPVSPAGEVR